MIEEAKAEDKNLQAEAEIATISYQSYTGKEFTFKKFLPAWEMAEDHPVVKTALDALVAAGVGSGTLGHYKFCTNGSLPDRHFGKPTIGFGPGDELYAHRKDEYINIDDLLAASRGYTTIAKALSHLET
jgi:acetylornithine deacetylase/succinyl-diaminopimelate desuccinylase-like protein